MLETLRRTRRPKPGPLLACAILLASGWSVLLAGCSRLDLEVQKESLKEVAALPGDEEIRQRLDDVLAFTYSNRRLNLRDHAAWQILHGALTYRRDFMVKNDGEIVSAVDHILAGGEMKGWTTERGYLLDSETKRYGLRALISEGGKQGQGHADQWLAVLAQCGLPPKQTIKVGNHVYTMEDFVSQVKLDVPRNIDREYSWTLIGLTSYMPTDSQWTAIDGQTWSIAKLVGIEAEQELAASACGGTHRLIGMAMALNHHIGEGGEIADEWRQADDRIQDAIRNAQQYQNPDGSFSTNYFERPGNMPDMAEALGSTGHTLEFLALAMTDEQLDQPWVKKAALSLSDLFRKTETVDLECGALYHAAHGLMAYRERVYGPWSPPQSKPSPDQPSLQQEETAKTGSVSP